MNIVLLVAVFVYYLACFGALDICSLGDGLHLNRIAHNENIFAFLLENQYVYRVFEHRPVSRQCIH